MWRCSAGASDWSLISENGRHLRPFKATLIFEHILKFETIFLLTGFFPFRFVVEKSEELNQCVFMMTPDTQAGSVWWFITLPSPLCVCLWRSGNKTELFSDLSDFPVLRERREQIQEVVDDIYEHRKEIRMTLKAPALDYTAVSGQEVPPVCVCVGERLVGGDWWPELGGWLSRSDDLMSARMCV